MQVVVSGMSEASTVWVECFFVSATWRLVSGRFGSFKFWVQRYDKMVALNVSFLNVFFHRAGPYNSPKLYRWWVLEASRPTLESKGFSWSKFDKSIYVFGGYPLHPRCQWNDDLFNFWWRAPNLNLHEIPLFSWAVKDTLNICLCLFKVISYGFYHGKSRLTHHWGNMSFILFATTSSKSENEMTILFHPWDLLFCIPNTLPYTNQPSM